MKVSVEKKHGHKRSLSPSLKNSKKKKVRRRSPSTSSCSSSSSSSSSSSFSSTSLSSSSSSSDSDERLKRKRKNRKARSPSSDTSSSSNRSSSSKRKHKKIVKTIKQKEKKTKKYKKKNLKINVKDDKIKKAQNEDEDASADVPLHLMESPKAIAPMTKEQWEKQQSIVKKVYDETTGRHSVQTTEQSLETIAECEAAQMDINRLKRRKAFIGDFKEDFASASTATQESSRNRLIKGDGEVIEEIVSREQHKKINAQATTGDGDYFQRKLSSNMPPRS